MRPWRASFSRSIAGYVSGIIQDGVGYRHGTPVITMHMEAYLGAPEPYDEVRVHGVPNLTLQNSGRRARRHRDRVDRGQFDPQGAVVARPGCRR